VQRKTNAVDKLAQRYKELEDQKQARKVVFVDKMTAPVRGKAARGRQGGMMVVKAGQPRRKSPLWCIAVLTFQISSLRFSLPKASSAKPRRRHNELKSPLPMHPANSTP